MLTPTIYSGTAVDHPRAICYHRRNTLNNYTQRGDCMSALTTGSSAPALGAEWRPLAPPDDPGSPSAGWWLSILERALISRAMDDLEVTKEYRPNPDKPHEGKLKFQFGAKGHEVSQLVAAS